MMGTVDEQQQNRESVLTADSAPLHEINFDGIAPRLKSKRRWVNWKWVRVGNKWTKVPIQTNGRNASSIDPETWTDFETAKAYAIAHNCGIGFIFDGDEVKGIDKDDCRNPVTGVIAPWAMYLIQTVDTYTEISPSGTGVKLFLTGTLPEQFRKKHNRPDGVGGVEIFATGRFFTVTGQHLPGTPNDVQDRDAELNRIYLDLCDWKAPASAQKPSTYLPTSYVNSNHSDWDLLELAIRAISNNPGIDYDDWLKVGMGVHSVDSSSRGLQLWIWFSQQSPKYVEGECERKWNSFKSVSGGTGPATVYYMADRLSPGWRPIVKRVEVPATREEKLKGAIELAYLELNSGSTVEEVSGPIIDVIARPSTSEMPAKPIAPQIECLPAKFLDVGPGFMRDVIDFVERGAHIPQPNLALASTITLAGMLMGRKVTDCEGTRTNIYCVGLAPSGAGKERGRSANKKLLRKAGASHLAPIETVASATAILSTMECQPAILLMLDEIGKFLGTIKTANNSPHLAEIIGTLLILFTSSSEAYLGKGYADTGKNRRIDQPCLCLYGTGVPEGVWSSLTTESLTDGLIARILFFETPEDAPPANRYPSQADPSPELVTLVQKWVRYSPHPDSQLLGDDGKPFATQRVLIDSPIVSDLFWDRRQEFADFGKAKTPGAGLWSRTYEKGRKLALIHACSRDFNAVEIPMESAEWGLGLSEHLTRRTIQTARDHISDNNNQRNINRIRNWLRKAGGSLPRGEVTQSFRGSVLAAEVDRLVDTMEASGELSREWRKDTGGRPKLVYKLLA